MKTPKHKKAIIVALDVDTRKEALRWVKRLGRQVDVFKVGLQLFSREGFGVVDAVIRARKKVFLDLKFHDIPNTVAQAVRNSARPGVEFLTIHASGGSEMISAAAKALREVRTAQKRIATRLLAVTVLTSLDEEDLKELGIGHSVTGQVLNLARMAGAAGADGLVASPHEVSLIRKEHGTSLTLVTPGVRLQAGPVHDQKRVMTPVDAIREGSDFLVMGRSLLENENPEKMLKEIIASISNQPVTSSILFP